jgi:hypothetical protein
LNDRIEEYRQDWHAGPVRPRRRRSTLLRPQTRGDWVAFLALLFTLGGTATLVWRYHGAMGRWVDARIRTTKTELEMSSIQRLLKQYYLSHGSLPERPLDYLKPFFRPNKAYPPGCDFWGRAYRIESFGDGYVLRSCGADGIPQNDDDLVRSVKYKEWTRDT